MAVGSGFGKLISCRAAAHSPAVPWGIRTAAQWTCRKEWPDWELQKQEYSYSRTGSNDALAVPAGNLWDRYSYRWRIGTRRSLVGAATEAEQAC
jgi:hypothetical protein